MNQYTRIEEVLASEGVYMTTTSGMSMYPMLRHRRDTVIIRPKSGKLKKYDIPLYKRDGSYVLHRVIRVCPDGTYNIRGDNCFETEKGISEEDIIGYLDGFWRDSKDIRMDSVMYRAYSRIWVALHPIVCVVKGIRSASARVYRGIFRKNKDEERF